VSIQYKLNSNEQRTTIYVALYIAMPARMINT